MQRRDIHIHLGVIDPFWALQGKAKKGKQKKLGRRIHSVAPTTIDDMRNRVLSEQLAQICPICDNAEYLRICAAALLGIAEVSPIYWVRNWNNPDVPPFAKGIKIHPMIEREDATVENLRKVMNVAWETTIPVLFHSEDENLTRSRGALLSKLAEAHPDVKIIAMHAGAYGAPQFMDHPDFNPRYADDLRTLVQEMIDAAVAHPNIYLETSCLAYPEKAQLLYKATREHPDLMNRIAMGSDYPILEDHPVHKRLNRFDHQEPALKASGFTDADIEKFYDNVHSIMPLVTARELMKKPMPQYFCAGLDSL